MKRSMTSGVSDVTANTASLSTLCGRVGDRLLVDVPARGIIEARTTLRLTQDALAAAIAERREAVVLLCGDVAVVTGLLEPVPADGLADAQDAELVLSSRKGVVLRCGEASIRLSPDGRVVVRGKDVVTRARRRNHVVGAAVRLN